MSNILTAAAAAADKAICSRTTTNGDDEVRAQNVSGLKLPKPQKKKNKNKKIGCTAQKQPESNLRACRRRAQLFVSPKRDEIQKVQKRERGKIKQAKLNLAETKSVKVAKENDAWPAQKKRKNHRNSKEGGTAEKVLLNLALCWQ